MLNGKKEANLKALTRSFSYGNMLLLNKHLFTFSLHAINYIDLIHVVHRLQALNEVKQNSISLLDLELGHLDGNQNAHTLGNLSTH